MLFYDKMCCVMYLRSQTSSSLYSTLPFSFSGCLSAYICTDPSSKHGASNIDPLQTSVAVRVAMYIHMMRVMTAYMAPKRRKTGELNVSASWMVRSANVPFGKTTPQLQDTLNAIRVSRSTSETANSAKIIHITASDHNMNAKQMQITLTISPAEWVNNPEFPKCRGDKDWKARPIKRNEYPA